MDGRNNRIDFQIGFSTDESGLKKLQANLTQIMNMDKNANPLKPLTQGEQDAIKKATILKDALQKAYNAELGTTNITKLNNELKKSGTTINECRNSFKNMGQQGANAYNLLGTQILSTNVKIKQTNKLLDKMAVTFANTVRFGISSSIFNNLTGAIQKAVGYAEDLDKSLTAIRIVSNKSADDMARFAKEANSAAKALGATTLEYTDASLIYYQQGLNDDEVQERTNVTMKMANVLSESASEVSDYMTAIWNNFDDGSKSLEYYGDVITALGASTASSAAEISEGLEKFAAVADTVGLSYEYATTALATVVAETRQSADVVGTAFKTLFARIQDLELGETLDDGTTLGKYSQALEAVGINIKDQNGQLKEMDAILDEMGSKWNTLSKDTQVALAQTVAGTRQYTQLVALMDNWDEFGENLKTASTATGTLQKQQDIYLQSTEAKLKTLKATWQDLYGTLVDKDELNAGIEGLTNFVQVFENFFESFGGGIKSIGMLGAVLSGVFNQQLANSIINIKDRWKEAADNAAIYQAKIDQIKAGSYIDDNGEYVEADSMQGKGYEANYKSQRDNASAIMEISKVLNEEEIIRLTKMQEEIGALEEQKAKYDYQVGKYRDMAINQARNVHVAKEVANIYQRGLEILKQEPADIALAVDELKEEALNAEKVAEAYKNAYNEITKQKSDAEWINKTEAQREQNLRKIIANLVSTGELTDKEKSKLDSIISSTENIKTREELVEGTLKKQLELREQNAAAAKETAQAVENQEKSNNIKNASNNKQGDFDSAIEAAKANKKLSDSITGVTTSLSSMAMAWSSVNSLMQTWSDDSISFGDKLLQTFMTLGMTVPIVISNLQKMGEALNFSTPIDLMQAKMELYNLSLEKNTAVTALNTAQTKLAEEQERLEMLQREANNGSIVAKAMLEEQETAVQAASVGVTEAKTAAEKTENAVNAQGIVVDNAREKSLLKVMAAKLGVKTATLGLAAALTAVVVVGVVAAMKAYKKHLEDVAKQTEKAADLAEEYADSLKIISDATNEAAKNARNLKSSFQDLYADWEKSGDSADTLRQKVYDLCVQYGFLKEGIEALNAPVNSLDDIVDNINVLANEQVIKDETNAQAAEKTKFQANTRNINAERKKDVGIYGDVSTDSTQYQVDYTSIINKGAKGFWDGIFKMLVSGHSNMAGVAIEQSGYVDKLNEELITLVDDIGGKYDTSTGAIDFSDADISYLAEHMSEILDKIEKSRNNLEKSGVDASTIAEFDRFTDYFSNFVVEYVNGQSEFNNNINEANKQIDLLNNDNKDFSNLVDLNALIKDLSSTGEFDSAAVGLSGEIAANAVKQAVLEWLSGQTSDAKQLGLIKQELFKTKIELNPVINWEDWDPKEIEKLSDSELGYLYLHIDDAEAYNSMKEFFNAYQGYIDFYGKQDIVIEVETVMKNSTERGGFLTGEDISTLYSQEGFEETAQMSANDFAAKSYITQMEIMLQYYDEEANQMQQSQKRAEEYLNQRTEAIQQAYQDDLASAGFDESTVNEYIKNAGDNLQVAIQTMQNDLAATQAQMQTDILAGLGDQVENASNQMVDDVIKAYATSGKSLEEYLEIIKTESPDSYAILIAAQNKWGDNTETVLKKYGNGETVLNNMSNALEDAATESNNMAGAQNNLAEAINMAAEAQKRANENLKGISSAYQTMTSVLKDYNENGALTVDNLENLLALEPQYLECLEIDGDKISINTELMKEKVLIDIQAAKAALYNEGAEKLKAIAAGEAADQDAYAAIQAEYLAKSLGSEEEALDVATKAFERYRETKKSAFKTDEQKQLAKAVEDDIEKRAALYDNLYNGLSSGKISLDKVLGKSSSKSSSEKKDKEHMKENIDAYHQWEQQIKACENALSELQERQGHLKGKQLLKNIQAQTVALKEQAAAQERLNAQYRAEAAALRGVLAAKGAAFDGNGNISNYSALLQQAQDKYNATVDAYNKKKTDANEKAVDNAKKEYDNLKDAIGDYEKALEGMQKAQQAMNELMQKQADIALAELETKWEIEFQMDTHKAQRQLSDFINNLNDDFRKSFTDWEKEFKNAKDNFFNDGIQGDIFNQIKKIEEIQDFMDDTKSRSIDEYTQHMIDTTTNPASFDPSKEGEYTFSEGDIFTSASDASEYLIQLGDQLKDLADELKSAYEAAWESYLEGINQAIEETDRLNNIIDKNIDKLEQYRKIQQLSLTGADSTKNSLEFNKTLSKQYEAQVQGFITQKEKLESLLATTGVTLRKDATGAIDESSVDVLNMDEDQKIIYEQILNYQDKILDTTVKRVENEREILDLETKHTMDDLATQMFGSSDVDYLKQQWEDALKWEERYYDGYEQIYQIEQLGKKYDDLKHKELSLKAQEKINKAKAVELEELSKSENLSKDELAIAEKRLEVVQAEIALEETQNNKNSMKLTRDETGNWSYQYVANEDDVAAKEQDLIDKTNEYYEKSKEAYQNGVEYAFEVWDTYSKKIMEIQQNNTISEEERQIRIQAVTDQMLKGFMTASTDVSKFQVDLATSAALLSKRVIEQNQIDIDNLSGVALAAAQTSNDARVSDLQTTRGEMKNEESGMLDDMKGYLKDGTEFFDTAASNAVGTWQGKEEEITNSILNASNTVQTKISEYQYKVQDYAKAIGLDLGNVSKSYDEVANSTDTAKEAVRNYINEQTSKLMGIKSEIDRIKAAWDIVATACKNAASSMQSYIGQTQAAIRESNSLAESARKAASEIEKMNSTKNSNKSNSTDKGDKKYRAEWMGGTYADTRFNIYEGNKKVAITGVPNTAFKNCKTNEDYSKAAKQWLLNNSKYAGNISFKTGGYTGEWSNGSVENNGRLAMLHQKELILNAKDTENMLDMVTMVREMQSASGAIDKAIINSIANMIGAITGVKVQSVGNTNSNNQNTSNTFNITAEFPNANDVNEIREAILSLPNLAQQYLSINTL